MHQWACHAPTHTTVMMPSLPRRCQGRPSTRAFNCFKLSCWCRFNVVAAGQANLPSVESTGCWPDANAVMYEHLHAIGPAVGKQVGVVGMRRAEHLDHSAKPYPCPHACPAAVLPATRSRFVSLEQGSRITGANSNWAFQNPGINSTHVSSAEPWPKTSLVLGYVPPGGVLRISTAALSVLHPYPFCRDYRTLRSTQNCENADREEFRGLRRQLIDSAAA